MVARDHQLQSIYTDSLEKSLDLGLLPVVYGDQMLDMKAGCTVFSTEKVLGYLGLALQQKGYFVERIIHCGQTNGVYDADGVTIPEINSENFGHYRSVLTGSNGVDVTGGMLHKVSETLGLAEAGIPGLIIDGIEHGSLSEAIAGRPVLGTAILRKGDR
jgi:isopentenyl phosphate kinase